jgi:hypothetical protein
VNKVQAQEVIKACVSVLTQMFIHRRDQTVLLTAPAELF